MRMSNSPQSVGARPATGRLCAATASRASAALAPGRGFDDDSRAIFRLRHAAEER
jgi:hypothetical protein